MKIRNTGAADLACDSIAHRAKLGGIDRELGRDDHRDASRRASQRLARGRQPRRIARRIPEDLDRDLATEPRRARPRAEIVSLDDLDEIPVEDAPDLRGFHATILRGACHLERVKPWIVLAIVAGAARADAGRCEQGIEYLNAKDLPRAALYLEGCEGDAVDQLHTKLSHSDLSQLSIVTSAPADGEIDAFPGEKLETPITLWVKAGTYKVHVERDGRIAETSVTLAAHSRTSVVLDVGAKTARPPRTGVVDFNEQGGEVVRKGPLPVVKRGTLVPKKD